MSHVKLNGWALFLSYFGFYFFSFVSLVSRFTFRTTCSSSSVSFWFNVIMFRVCVLSSCSPWSVLSFETVSVQTEKELIRIEWQFWSVATADGSRRIIVHKIKEKLFCAIVTKFVMLRKSSSDKKRGGRNLNRDAMKCSCVVCSVKQWKRRFMSRNKMISVIIHSRKHTHTQFCSNALAVDVFGDVISVETVDNMRTIQLRPTLTFFNFFFCYCLLLRMPSSLTGTAAVVADSHQVKLLAVVLTW